MTQAAQEALRRLRQKIGPGNAALWLEGATVESALARGGPVLRVRSPFARERLRTAHAAALVEAFGGPIEVVCDAAPAPRAPPRAADRIAVGPGNDLAVRLVRAFAEGGDGAAPLLVLYGPNASGKTLLCRLASSLGGRQVFRLDPARLRSGSSFFPRKPLVVADGVEALAGKKGAQRALCVILDGLADRGGRALVTLRGHPRECAGLEPALRSRLLGGLLAPVQPVGGRVRPAPTHAEMVSLLKDAAARAFQVERALLDAATKRRVVVEAKRAVITEAARAGVPKEAIAAAMGLRSVRTVHAARRWIESRSARDAKLAALVRAIGGVLPRR
jgi:hypothetical protein